jgi:hypothetical protein
MKCQSSGFHPPPAAHDGGLAGKWPSLQFKAGINKKPVPNGLVGWPSEPVVGKPTSLAVAAGERILQAGGGGLLGFHHQPNLRIIHTCLEAMLVFLSPRLLIFDNIL